MKTFFVSIFLLLLNNVFLAAQAGSLDPSFGVGGTAITSITGSSVDYPSDCAIQPDGKILVTGYYSISNARSIFLVRYNQNGTPDSTFGSNGIVKTSFGSSQAAGNAVAVQPDGKILVAGQSTHSNIADYALVRYKMNGELDSTFGTAGKVVTDLGSTFETSNALAIQADGKIISAGSVYGASVDFGVVRYNSNGSLDSAFGVGGIVVTSIADEDQANAVRVQPDGKIVVAGFSSINAKGDFSVVRYNTDGTLDKNFGTGGKVTTNIQNSDLGYDLLIHSNGKILVAGTVGYVQVVGGPIGLVQYNEDGSLDTGFGTGGKSIIATGNPHFVWSLARQPDGKIFVGSESLISSNNKQWSLSRALPNGTIDATFGTNGVVNTDLIGTSEYSTSMLIQPDAKIVMAGGAGGASSFDLVVCRYLNDFVSGTTDVPQALAFNISPNPGNGLFSLRMETPASSLLHLTVSDMSGRIVHSDELKDMGTIEQMIDLRYLNNGLYQIRLDDGRNWGVQRLVIAK